MSNSLNKWIGIGRLGKELELKKTNNQISVTSFTIACERNYTQGSDHKAESDWIDCQAWKNTADYLTKYAHKGDRLAIEGHLQKRSYKDQDGRNVYITEVIVEKAIICNSKQNSDKKTEESEFKQGEDPELYSNDNSLDISSDDLPF
jgi:single-strand DNA-binding protein